VSSHFKVTKLTRHEVKNMATTTTVVRGRYYDGVTSATAGYIAKKINDVTTAAANIYAVSIAKSGQELVAVIVYN